MTDHYYFICGQPALFPIPFCFYAVDASVLVFLSRQNATPQMEFSCHMTAFFYSRKGAFWSHGAKGFYLRGIHLVRVFSE